MQITGGRMSRLGKRLDKLALRITNGVGSMGCALIFTLIALVSLPETINEAVNTQTINPIIQWVTQTFLQLVLLSIVLRGQNIAGEKQEQMVNQIHGNTEKIEAAAERIEHIVKIIERMSEKELKELRKEKQE